MTIKIFNTMTRKKEIFEPINKDKVMMFVCGPTVYDHSHLGHARTYVAFDIISRWLRYRGYNLYYLQNITDLDDKIIQRARELGISPKELVSKFEEAHYKDMELLGITSVNKYAPATDFISAIIKQVKTLIEKDFAYLIEDGIYYDISKFSEYGKLSGRTILEAEDAVSRIDESVQKKNKGDFCIWKISKPDEPKWNFEIEVKVTKEQFEKMMKTPASRFIDVINDKVRIKLEGRPGWHIEDTAISESHFGPQYDIHGGARDLIFPHHEAEISLMEAASGKKPFVRYWLHTGFLTVNGEKMAKSLGNFITIKDALKKFDAETLRLFFAFTHYRSPIDFTEKNLEQSKKSLDRLYTTLENVHSMKTVKNITPQEKQFDKKFLGYKQKFIDSMDDDFNTLEALKVLFKMSNEVNRFITHRKELNKDVKENILNMFKELGSIFGILQKEIKKEELSDEIKKLVDEREEARKKKDWKTADAIRTKLSNMGVILEDTLEGIKWKIKK